MWGARERKPTIRFPMHSILCKFEMPITSSEWDREVSVGLAFSHFVTKDTQCIQIDSPTRPPQVKLKICLRTGRNSNFTEYLHHHLSHSHGQWSMVSHARTVCSSFVRDNNSSSNNFDNSQQTNPTG